MHTYIALFNPISFYTFLLSNVPHYLFSCFFYKKLFPNYLLTKSYIFPFLCALFSSSLLPMRWFALCPKCQTCGLNPSPSSSRTGHNYRSREPRARLQLQGVQYTLYRYTKLEPVTVRLHCG